MQHIVESDLGASVSPGFGDKFSGDLVHQDSHVLLGCSVRMFRLLSSAVYNFCC